jgi:hypothetical protein
LKKNVIHFKRFDIADKKEDFKLGICINGKIYIFKKRRKHFSLKIFKKRNIKKNNEVIKIYNMLISKKSIKERKDK